VDGGDTKGGKRRTAFGVFERAVAEKSRTRTGGYVKRYCGTETYVNAVGVKMRVEREGNGRIMSVLTAWLKPFHISWCSVSRISKIYGTPMA
jgi:hypothetical protein